MHRPLLTNSSLFLVVITLIVFQPTAHAGVIANGSFETGNFAGWGVIDLASPYNPLTVRSNGYNSGFFTTSATNGVFSATHGFDGGGPGTIRIFQDIGIVDSLTNLLSFDYRAAWMMSPYGGTIDRTFSLNVFQQGTFSLIGANEILRARKLTDNFDTGALSTSINLSSFIGQSIRISFDAVIPQNFTGPAFLQLDNVRLSSTPVASTVPEPNSALVFGLIAIGLSVRNWRSQRCLSAREKRKPCVL